MSLDYFAFLVRVVRPTVACVDCGAPVHVGTLCQACADARDVHTSALEHRLARTEAA
jgi:hypothetical protein